MSTVIKACGFSVSCFHQRYTSINRCIGWLKPIKVRDDMTISNHREFVTKCHLNQQRFLSISEILCAKDPTDKKTEAKKEYIIRFKEGVDLSKMFKEFYSLYGPLFIINYIAISIGTLASFTALCYSSVDLTFLATLNVFSYLDESSKSWTESGGKFLIAYGLHKLTMPLRILGAAFLTKRLAHRVNWFIKNPKDDEID